MDVFREYEKVKPLAPQSPELPFLQVFLLVVFYPYENKPFLFWAEVR